MKDTAIQISNLTKNYGENRGIFDVNLEVKEGEVYGFIGINGAGKTTTIRNLMGFIKPTSGSSSILGLDSWKNKTEIKNFVSYIPGEIAFPNLSTGTEFLKLQAEYLHVKDYSYMNKLIKMLQLDTSASLKRMSKGMKQKTAIVAALIGNKNILILDEPTTGLDPLMRDVFIELILEEKRKGKTIFMSSHIFEEIECVCDKASIIKQGKIIDTVDINNLKKGNLKTFKIEFLNNDEFKRFTNEYKNIAMSEEVKKSCTVKISINEINEFLNNIKNYKVKFLREHHLTLEEYFKSVYKEEKG